MSKVRGSDIRAELRPAAQLLKLTYTASNEASFAKFDRQCIRKYRGKWKSINTLAEEKALVREDGSILRILVVRSEKNEREGATGLLWLHDGGFAFGIPEQESILVDMFCGDGSCVAILPDYTKSTESPYPAALEDCYKTLLWMKDNAEALGINRNQIFVGGCGAGGGLTAALCLRARDVRDVRIAFQMPIAPMLDDRMESESANANNAPVWDSKKNRAAWDLYLKDMKEEIPVYAAPGRESDLSGMPAACGIVGDLEPVKDEAVLYFARMKKAGVPVSLRVYHGCFHGFETTAVGSSVALNAQRYLVESLQYAQKHYYAYNELISEIMPSTEEEPQTEEEIVEQEEAQAQEEIVEQEELQAEEQADVQAEESIAQDEPQIEEEPAEEAEAEESAEPEQDEESEGQGKSPEALS